MTVRCEQCGHENDTQYHFCGMCGSPLRSPIAPSAAPPRTNPPVTSVPSFLGLAEEPKRNLSYLLEDDEEPPSHRGLYFVVVVVLLLVLGGGIAWHWWNGTWPWETHSTDSATRSPSAPAPSVTVTPLESNSPSQAVAPPAEPSTSAAPVPPPAAANQAVVPVPPPVEKEAAAPAPATSAPVPEAENKPASPNAVTPDASNPAADAATESPSALPAPAEKIKPGPAPKVETPKPRPAAAPVSSEEKLVADGERYLYGTGVPQNCDRAQKNLLAAARQEDSKAYTLLGAMYATGHCVTRDLPSAYRWFARALHQDPGNTRLQQNLEVIWKQMTPEERTAATRGE